jgi:hypothetical protein
VERINYDFGSVEGVRSIASYHKLKFDDSKSLKKGRNVYLHSFIMTYGDKLPLQDILRTALSYTLYIYDVEKCTDLKAIILFILGVTDKKGKVMPNIKDGCEGWFRVSHEVEKSCMYSDEFYLSVSETVANHFKTNDDKGDLMCLGKTMVDNLLGWTKMLYTYDTVEIVFQKSLYYMFFDHELEEMKSYIFKNKLFSGRKKDKVASACMEVLDAIKKGNSVLPKGFNERSQKEIDKIFNFENAGMGSVPFHDEFGVESDTVTSSVAVGTLGNTDAVTDTSRTKVKSCAVVVTPDKKNDVRGTARAKRTCENIKTSLSDRRPKKKGSIVPDVEDSDDDGQDDIAASDTNEDGHDTVVGGQRNVVQAPGLLSQRYVGKCSVLAMIAAQAPVLHRPLAQEENRKRLQISFTTPIKQAKGTYKVAIFIDSVNGDKQIYTWKSKPLIYALGLPKVLKDLHLGDRNDAYCDILLQNINRYMPIRRYPGESNDEIKKAGSAYLFQAGGVLELQFPSILQQDIHDELDKIVQSFRKIISDANFHECYSLGAARSYIEVYKNNDAFVEHAQALMRTGKSLDYTGNKLAYDIYTDYENLFSNINDLHIEVIRDCPLDVLLRNSDIKDVGRRLFGNQYNDAYAPIVFRNPRGKDFKTL